MSDNRAESATVYEFRIGESYDDVAPVFVVDGRDYADAGQVLVDVRAAAAALDRLGLISEV
jgi:hypothetical protein